MKFHQSTSHSYIPDGRSFEEVFPLTTHLAVVAHHDDTEILAIDGILRCFQAQDLWFSSAIVTDGRGSPRSGAYQDYTDDDMRLVRIQEQKKAAMIGKYAAQIFLEYPSAQIKDSACDLAVEDIMDLVQCARPEVIYTHNLADRHDTHVAVALRVIEALRRLPSKDRPQKLYGAEVWRDLDWLHDADKIVFDCSPHESLQRALLGVFDSQISGGKRYDLATMGRRAAHATYSATHKTDIMTGCTFALDLTPLIHDPSRDIASFLEAALDRFKREVIERLYTLR